MCLDPFLFLIENHNTRSCTFLIRVCMLLTIKGSFWNHRKPTPYLKFELVDHTRVCMSFILNKFFIHHMEKDYFALTFTYTRVWPSHIVVHPQIHIHKISIINHKQKLKDENNLEHTCRCYILCITF